MSNCATATRWRDAWTGERDADYRRSSQAIEVAVVRLELIRIVNVLFVASVA